MEKGKLEGKLESAKYMSEYGINPKEIAQKLDIPLELLLESLKKR